MIRSGVKKFLDRKPSINENKIHLIVLLEQERNLRELQLLLNPSPPKQLNKRMGDGSKNQNLVLRSWGREAFSFRNKYSQHLTVKLKVLPIRN